MRVSLVPAFAQCTANDQTHGGPLPFPDCSTLSATPGGTPTSSMVIWGPSSIGFARIMACPVGGTGQCAPADPPNPAVNGDWNPPDIRVTASIIDLRCGPTAPNCPTVGVSPYNPNPTASHYTVAGTSANGPSPLCFPASPNPPGGTNPTCASTPDAQLQTTIPGSAAGNGVRITDHGNGPNSDLGTTVDSAFPVPVDCGIAGGTNCGVNTSVNALVGGAVTTGRQGVIEVGQVKMLDAATNAFAVQGVFSP
jgi:hypothetical protein